MMGRRWMGAALVAATVLFASADTFAVIGRPLTPMSYAGVARRTSRRTTYRAAAYNNSNYYSAPPATTAVAATVATGSVVTTLPAGCTTVATGGVSYRQCGGAYYRPYYDGPNLVYVAATP